MHRQQLAFCHYCIHIAYVYTCNMVPLQYYSCNAVIMLFEKVTLTVTIYRARQIRFLASCSQLRRSFEMFLLLPQVRNTAMDFMDFVFFLLVFLPGLPCKMAMTFELVQFKYRK